MKKARIFTLLALIAILSACLFVGCGENEDTVTSVSLKGYDPVSAIEIAIGSFDCNAYTVVVTYESGRSEETALTEDMIAETDLFKLYQVGDHEITIHYGGQTSTFRVSVKRETFGALAFPENTVFTYDGKAHTVEVDGEIPANAVVTYPSGNSFVNVGTYDVTAVVSCEGYVTRRLTATVTVKRATYDMSGVKFEGREIVYDGNTHSLAVSGTLPEGVSSPRYTINGKTGSSATNVGEYTVKATFVNTDPNYETIPEMEATLRITPAVYTVKGVDLVFKHENGIALDGASKVYDGKSVTFDLNDYNQLSQKVSVSFSVCDKDGTVISTSHKNTGMINAGIYTVKAEFTIADGENYQPITPLVRTFEILKADYPTLENIQFTSAQKTYDGMAHSLAITGQLPDGVTVSYEYSKNGVRVDDADGRPAQSVVDAGRYTVTAVFSHSDGNRKEIEPLSATLYVERATINVLEFGFDYRTKWEYDGTPKSVTVTRQPEYVEVSLAYYLNGALVMNEEGTAPATAVTEVGAYTVEITITAKNDNYAPMEPLQLTFAIVAPQSN